MSEQVITKPENLIQVTRYQGPSWYRTVKSVSGVPCQDGHIRTAYTTNGEPDTFFSTPAHVYVYDPSVKRSRKVTGFLTTDETGYRFHADLYGRNAYLLANQEEIDAARAEYPESFK